MSPDKDKRESKDSGSTGAGRDAETFGKSLRDLTMPESIDPAVLDSFEEIVTRYKNYTDVDESEKLRNAFIFAYKAHGAQLRRTGEPYIIHPLATTEILTELEVDTDTLVAALLHDTVEDTDVDLGLIEELFGDEVVQLVDGVTKLSKISYSSKEEVQAENMRKMFLAMAKDIRVVLIKLADRLHNMRTMKHLSPEKQLEKALETRDIYAPLAHRLGIYKIKWELEDLSLRYIDRDAYYELVGAISQRRTEREQFLEEVVAELQIKVSEMGIQAEIEGRPKHFYSIYSKMKVQGKNLDQIYDLFACRVIVGTVADCYAVLGLVHEMYYPMPGRFKDYIAMPKPNMYQSLHTTVIGKKGIPFEVQIRTLSMHRTAEYGIAAHWRYKQGLSGASGQSALDSKLSWLRQLLDWQGDSKDATEYLDSLKIGLVADEVFVFTPKGDVISLPKQSTPIDFAYNIHSGVGNRMYGAKVNGRIVPLSYELQNGDIVEILASEKVHGPSRDWLKMVKSASARSKINQWFKKEMRDENITHGKEIIERDIKKTGFTAEQLLKPAFIDVALKKFSFGSIEDLYAAVGYGGIPASKIIGKLKDEHIKALPEEERFALGYRVTSAGQVVYSPLQANIAEDGEITPSKTSGKAQRRKQDDTGVRVKGIDNCLVHLSRCCSPMPGDPIIGFVTRGNGVGVHRTDCANIKNILKNSGESGRDAEKASRLIDVYWDQRGETGGYQIEISILAHDRNHLLADVSNAISEEKVSILSASLKAMKDVTANIRMTVEVRSQSQYDRVVGRLKAISDVIEVRRGH
ncbi:MAG: bifunctional (p)ppGpp synthetase/guanosine-3',5'-bis(diphosphate) 3'-pyrophosphohydrolase [Oscillospiraceae bacterium]|jgi:GTP pyrophosphokinase|nr:bifunctional (p)ppGpp synthetase/guanosine-3',5'-bis(diphosphate) 3'-pyrophosphohydrolase [Oscillospiraceae bacterium]